MNFNSLIATKTNRIVSSAGDRLVMEFGARRAQGADASITGARAAYIAGAPITSNTYSAKKYNFKASGTMAHSWIQAFDSEYEAFKTYAKMYPTNCILLIDTYDTLESGLVNAMKVFKEGDLQVELGLTQEIWPTFLRKLEKDLMKMVLRTLRLSLQIHLMNLKLNPSLPREQKSTPLA